MLRFVDQDRILTHRSNSFLISFNFFLARQSRAELDDTVFLADETEKTALANGGDGTAKICGEGNPTRHRSAWA